MSNTSGTRVTGHGLGQPINSVRVSTANGSAIFAVVRIFGTYKLIVISFVFMVFGYCRPIPTQKNIYMARVIVAPA